MRRRDGVRVALAGLLAAAGVLVLPVGASSGAEGEGEPTAVPSPTGTPTGTPTPTGPTGDPDPTTTPEPTEQPTSPTGTSTPTGGPTPTPTTDPDPEPEPEPDELEVSDAVFTWTVSQQTNARSHNPVAINFMSAGTANPGRGGALLPRSRWKAAEGDVEIQKLSAARTYRRATWAGLSTDASGAPIGIYGPFSGHRVTISSGAGTVAPATDDATVSWKGTFTVVYYGGNTVFTLTDPVLSLDGGDGTLTALAGGWAADRDDPRLWKKLTPEQVTVADLRDVDVTKDGTIATPAYEGVEVTGSEPQKRTGEGWGAFPQSFVTYLRQMGTDQFWYSTGLQSDWTKTPDPISIGWDGVPPTTQTPATSRPTPVPDNAVSTAPDAQAPPPLDQPLPLDVPPLDVAAAEEPVPPWRTPVQVSAAAPTTADAALASASTSSTAYVAGGALLLAAAGLLLAPYRPRRP